MNRIYSGARQPHLYKLFSDHSENVSEHKLIQSQAKYFVR